MSIAGPSQRHVLISFPGAEYTHQCAVEASEAILAPLGWKVHQRTNPSDDDETTKWASEVVQSSDDGHSSPVLYLMDYDLIPFDSIHPSKASTSFSSCYPIRKALIRKNWLFNSIHSHSVKASSKAGVDISQSALRHLPPTWNIDVQFADDLDELLIDELYDLAQQLEKEDNEKWYILKAGMADRGMGIRLFNSLDGLREILEEFEGSSSGECDEDDDDQGDAGDTAVSLSQLRHFVIQEYLQPPLLIAPNSSGTLRKFHLRAYVLCVGGLAVYLHDEMLALFAPCSYQSPSATDDTRTSQPDPRIHLTNTCLHSDGSTTSDGRLAEENVHLFSDLVGKPYNGSTDTLTKDQITSIQRLAVRTIGETFEAAAKGAASTNWIMWENTWEVFGVDLMVTCGEEKAQFKVALLEVNAQPDFAQSGHKLQGVIRRIFERTLQVAVLGEHGQWDVGQSRDGVTLCFSERMRGGW